MYDQCYQRAILHHKGRSLNGYERDLHNTLSIGSLILSMKLVKMANCARFHPESACIMVVLAFFLE
jgi:hypothetical protein